MITDKILAKLYSRFPPSEYCMIEQSLKKTKNAISFTLTTDKESVVQVSGVTEEIYEVTVFSGNDENRQNILQERCCLKDLDVTLRCMTKTVAKIEQQTKLLSKNFSSLERVIALIR